MAFLHPIKVVTCPKDHNLLICYIFLFAYRIVAETYKCGATFLSIQFYLIHLRFSPINNIDTFGLNVHIFSEQSLCRNKNTIHKIYITHKTIPGHL